ncbi:hypothetical protein J2Z40_002308 [Cytobacillus eiseniae]|uniref:Uncharacterized protein n=1 Tax=Cytobacillus eiseniae TaxID=762947 RepID=A0ABS4RH29_9BACI|nr:hypothetical protein [Cytobacillus eiseniae]
MPFEMELQETIRDYVYGHLPSESWYNINFYPFIEDSNLRERLKTEFINARVIYKMFEGLQATDELLLAQIKNSSNNVCFYSRSSIKLYSI